MPDWGCLKEVSQVEALRHSGCLPGPMRLRHPWPSMLLRQEVWVRPGLAESRAGPRLGWDRPRHIALPQKAQLQPSLGPSVCLLAPGFVTLLYRWEN